MIHHLQLGTNLDNVYQKMKEKLMERITEDEMLPLYRQLCESLNWIEDEVLVEKLQAANAEQLKILDEKIEDATENFGDSEIREALLSKANYYCKIGNRKLAVESYEVVFDKTIGAGGRLDAILSLIRIGLFYGDMELTKKNVAKAKEELEKGGDWERRNKLKVYESVQLMMCRHFKEAALLLLDSISTFTATELMSFQSFIFYVVILSMVALDRPTLRSKVIYAPEVLQVVAEDETLKEFLQSFFHCKYLRFMQNLVPISKRVKENRYMGPHYLYYIRSIRLRAYAQFLEPYKSVTLENMASSFGVSNVFIEREVASFIASGKLNCKIDRVNGVVESNNPDARNKLYQQIIKQGDVLLNRVQRLSR
ncbi:putative 26s proteasome regulatory complex subunit, partial [Cardiosporidium cionae]